MTDHDLLTLWRYETYLRFGAIGLVLLSAAFCGACYGIAALQEKWAARKRRN